MKLHFVGQKVAATGIGVKIGIKNLLFFILEYFNGNDN